MAAKKRKLTPAQQRNKDAIEIGISARGPPSNHLEENEDWLAQALADNMLPQVGDSKKVIDAIVKEAMTYVVTAIPAIACKALCKDGDEE